MLHKDALWRIYVATNNKTYLSLNVRQYRIVPIRHWAEVEVKIETCSTSALEAGGWSVLLPGRFTPAKRPGTYFTRISIKYLKGCWAELLILELYFPNDWSLGGSYFHPLRTQSNVNFIWRTGSYRAVNTLNFVYQNQPVKTLQGNNRCLFWDVHKRRNSLCGR